jgi:hypothetical protein
MRRPRPNLDEAVKNGAAIDQAVRDAARAALLRHQKLGLPIAIYRDGKVVIVPPEKIGEELERSGNVPDAPTR